MTADGDEAAARAAATAGKSAEPLRDQLFIGHPAAAATRSYIYLLPEGNATGSITGAAATVSATGATAVRSSHDRIACSSLDCRRGTEDRNPAVQHGNSENVRAVPISAADAATVADIATAGTVATGAAEAAKSGDGSNSSRESNRSRRRSRRKRTTRRIDCSNDRSSNSDCSSRKSSGGPPSARCREPPLLQRLTLLAREQQHAVRCFREEAVAGAAPAETSVPELPSSVLRDAAASSAAAVAAVPRGGASSARTAQRQRRSSTSSGGVGRSVLPPLPPGAVPFIPISSNGTFNSSFDNSTGIFHSSTLNSSLNSSSFNSSSFNSGSRSVSRSGNTHWSVLDTRIYVASPSQVTTVSLGAAGVEDAVLIAGGRHQSTAARAAAEQRRQVCALAAEARQAQRSSSISTSSCTNSSSSGSSRRRSDSSLTRRTVSQDPAPLQRDVGNAAVAAAVSAAGSSAAAGLAAAGSRRHIDSTSAATEPLTITRTVISGSNTHRSSAANRISSSSSRAGNSSSRNATAARASESGVDQAANPSSPRASGGGNAATTGARAAASSSAAAVCTAGAPEPAAPSSSRPGGSIRVSPQQQVFFPGSAGPGNAIYNLTQQYPYFYSAAGAGGPSPLVLLSSGQPYFSQQANVMTVPAESADTSAATSFSMPLSTPSMPFHLLPSSAAVAVASTTGAALGNHSSSNRRHRRFRRHSIAAAPASSQAAAAQHHYPSIASARRRGEDPTLQHQQHVLQQQTGAGTHYVTSLNVLLRRGSFSSSSSSSLGVAAGATGIPSRRRGPPTAAAAAASRAAEGRAGTSTAGTAGGTSAEASGTAQDIHWTPVGERSNTADGAAHMYVGGRQSSINSSNRRSNSSAYGWWDPTAGTRILPVLRGFQSHGTIASPAPLLTSSSTAVPANPSAGGGPLAAATAAPGSGASSSTLAAAAAAMSSRSASPSLAPLFSPSTGQAEEGATVVRSGVSLPVLLQQHQQQPNVLQQQQHPNLLQHQQPNLLQQHPQQPVTLQEHFQQQQRGTPTVRWLPGGTLVVEGLALDQFSTFREGMLLAAAQGVDVLQESRGVSAQVLQWLPEESYDPRRGVALSDDSDARACNICMMKYEHNERLRRLPCLHAFHAECVGRWLQEHTSCPLCRFEVSQGLRWEWSSPMAAAGASSSSVAARGLSSAATDAVATSATPVYSAADGNTRSDAFAAVTSPAALAGGRARPRSGSTPAALSSPHARSSSSNSATPASPSVSLAAALGFSAAASSSSAAAVPSAAATSSVAASIPPHVCCSTAAPASSTSAYSSLATEAAFTERAASSLITAARQEQAFASVSSAASATAATASASSSSPPASCAPAAASAVAPSATLASQRVSRDAPAAAVSSAASGMSHAQTTAAAVSSTGASAASDSPPPCASTAVLRGVRQSAAAGAAASSAYRPSSDSAPTITAAASSHVIAHSNCEGDVNTSKFLHGTSRQAISVASISSVSPQVSIAAGRLVDNSLSADPLSTSQSAGASTTTTSSLYGQRNASITSSSPEQYAAHVETFATAAAATVAAGSCSSQSAQLHAVAARSSSNKSVATTAAVVADSSANGRNSGEDPTPADASLNNVHAGTAAATPQAETSETLRTAAPALYKRRVSTGDDRTLNRLLPGNSSFAVAATAGARADAAAARYFQEAGQQSPPCSSVAAAAAALITAARSAQRHQPETAVKPSSRAGPRAAATEAAGAHPLAASRRLSAGASGSAAEATRSSTKAEGGGFTMAGTAAAAPSSAAVRPPAAPPSETRMNTGGCLALLTSAGTQAKQAGISEGPGGRSHATGVTMHAAGPPPAAAGTRVANATQDSDAEDIPSPLLAERSTSCSSAIGAAERSGASSANALSLLEKAPGMQKSAARSLIAAAAGKPIGDGESCAVRWQQRAARENSNDSSGAAPLPSDSHGTSLLPLAAVICAGTREAAGFFQSPAEQVRNGEASLITQAAAARLQATGAEVPGRHCDAAAAAAGGNEIAIRAKSVEGVKHLLRPAAGNSSGLSARNSSLRARCAAASAAASAAAAEETAIIAGNTALNTTAPAAVVQPLSAPRRASQTIAITKAAAGSLSVRTAGASERTVPSVSDADFTCSVRRRSSNDLERLSTAGNASTVSEAAQAIGPQTVEAGAVANRTEENELHVDCPLSKDESSFGKQAEQPRGQREEVTVSALDSKYSSAAAESHRIRATTSSRRRAAAARLSTAFRAISSTFAHLSPRTDRSAGNPRVLSPEAAAAAGQPVHNAPPTHRDGQRGATTTRLEVIPTSNRSTFSRSAAGGGSVVSSVALAEGGVEPTGSSHWPRRLSPFSSSCPSIASEHVSLSPHRSAASSLLSGGTNSSRMSTPPSSADISPVASNSEAYRGTGAAAATAVATKTPHIRATAEMRDGAASLLRSAAADDALNLYKQSENLVVHGRVLAAFGHQEPVSVTIHTEVSTAAEEGDTTALPPQEKPGAAAALPPAEGSSQGCRQLQHLTARESPSPAG